MNTLCHAVSAAVAGAAALGAITFLVLWGRNGFRGVYEGQGGGVERRKD